MPYICPICDKDPTSHSFKKVGSRNNVNYYYTCPAKATKYNDNKGILEHYKGILDENENEPWVWLFDSEGFETKHALNISLAIDLAKLIDRYRDSLQKIEIINATWHIRGTLKLVLPFLDEKTKKVIRINDNI